MNALKLIGKGIVGTLALLVALVGYALGLALCVTIVGLVPGVLMLVGSTGITAWVITLWGRPDVSEQVRARMSSMRPSRLARSQQV